jgi:hypothetical protein
MSRHGFWGTKTCQNGRKMGRHAFCTCICEKKVVPLHPIVLIRTEKMNIREIIKEVEYIYYFSGGVAFFRAKDERGRYQGLIDKTGEIVWDIKWRTPALRLSAFPNYIKTANEKKEWIYLDVRTLEFVTEPECVRARESSRAWRMAHDAPKAQFIKGIETPFDVPMKRYLNEAYIAFAVKDRSRNAEEGSIAALLQRKWGVQDLEGKEVLPAIFEDVDMGGKENHFVVKYDGLCGVMDDKQKWIIPREYADIICYKGNGDTNGVNDHYVAFIGRDKTASMCGLLDKDGQVLLPFEYENIFPSPTEQLITVQQAGQWRVINPKGETVFEIGK